MHVVRHEAVGNYFKRVISGSTQKLPNPDLGMLARSEVFQAIDRADRDEIPLQSTIQVGMKTRRTSRCHAIRNRNRRAATIARLKGPRDDRRATRLGSPSMNRSLEHDYRLACASVAVDEAAIAS